MSDHVGDGTWTITVCLCSHRFVCDVTDGVCVFVRACMLGGGGG